MKRFGIGVALVGCLLVVALGALVASNFSPGFTFFGNESEARTTQVMNSITREEQVVLLSLGIQGISEKTDNSQFLGIDIPGSKRASFVQYTFTAKLGIEGEDVTITETDDDEYRITVPEFVFIGHDDETFRLVAEDNGLLSLVTPKIDSVEMINTILDDDAQEEYIEANQEVLRDQAVVFYTSIINGIDPDITLTFEFRQGPR